MAAYIRADQWLGRVRGDVDPEAAAYMMLDALYQYVYWRQFLGRTAKPEADHHFVAKLLNALDRVLTPVPS